jgi:citrate lyase subunit beta/citryl-CoA lyase
VRSARSLLFVPGDRPDRFDKAAASGAHEVILDLEDAVAPAAKAEARASVAAWLAAGHRAFVRINALPTEWHADELRMLQAAPSAGVMLPKADTDSLARTAQALPGRRIIALVETVAGYLSLAPMARVPGLERIAFGSVDFAAESGIADEGETLTSVRIQIVLQSCHAGLAAPIDGVSVDFSDEARMRADALRSRQLGFGAKLCIHPRQIAAVHAAFAPSADELTWAERVVAATARCAGGAVAVDGRMVDRPVLLRARALLARRS